MYQLPDLSRNTTLLNLPTGLDGLILNQALAVIPHNPTIVVLYHSFSHSGSRENHKRFLIVAAVTQLEFASFNDFCYGSPDPLDTIDILGSL